MDKTMTPKHKECAQGRWAQLSFCEQMANIGSEVSRALNWRQKGNAALSQKAADRMLELLDLTIAPIKDYPRLKELLRAREGLVDFFYGTNTFSSSATLWRKYFDPFLYAARKNY